MWLTNRDRPSCCSFLDCRREKGASAAAWLAAVATPPPRASSVSQDLRSATDVLRRGLDVALRDRRPPWRGDGERSYSWWSGAWKVSPKAKGKHEKTLKTSAFPAYDANWVSAAGIAEVQGARQPKPVTGNLVTDVQAAVNTARRLDQKLAKLRAETIKLSQSWNEYVTQETQAYNKEKSRHESDQRRIAAEIQDLEQQQMAAYYQVRHVASTSGKDSEVPSPAPVTDLESQLAIDAMDIADGWTDESLGADLARIMAATVPAPGLAPSPGPPTFTPQRPTNAVPRTPVGHSGPAPSPAENGEGKPGLLHAPGADPYLVSPGMAHFGMPPATPPAASRTFGGGAAPGNGDVLPVVAPVDIAGMKTRLSPLSERLSLRRRETRQALAPFGLAHRAAPACAGDAAPPAHPDTGQSTPGGLIYDDEELGATAAPASPGLGNLE
eukprot:s575_g12.t1